MRLSTTNGKARLSSMMLAKAFKGKRRYNALITRTLHYQLWDHISGWGLKLRHWEILHLGRYEASGFIATGRFTKLKKNEYAKQNLASGTLSRLNLMRWSKQFMYLCRVACSPHRPGTVHGEPVQSVKVWFIGVGSGIIGHTGKNTGKHDKDAYGECLQVRWPSQTRHVKRLYRIHLHVQSRQGAGCS